ncbi:MAG: hypothetical protein ACREQ3_24965, partial [Candidatus Binatia bacterium]
MIVVVEGINGAGKTMVARMLADLLSTDYRLRVDIADPALHTPFGRGIWSSIMETRDLGADAQLLAFASARLDGSAAIASLLRVSPRRVVILERWSGALEAYGLAEEVDGHLLDAVLARMARALPVEAQY